MALITYADKDNSLPTSDVRRLYRDVDANEVKNVVNANQAIVEALDAAAVGADPAGTAATLVAAATVGLWDDRGTFSAAGGAYPSSGGSGTAGAILKGDIWTISTGGTLPTGQVVEVGDTVRALIDTPGNTQANWAILQNNIGFVPAPIASPTFTGTPAAPTAAANTNNTQVATTAYTDAKVADAINDGTTTIAPSQNAVFDALALKAAITYVDAQVATKYDFLVSLRTLTASHTLDATDLASVNAGDQLVIQMNSASANNMEIPLNAAQAFPVGTIIGIRNINTGITTITITATGTLSSPLSAFNLSNQYDMAYIEKTATNTWIANGQLSL